MRRFAILMLVFCGIALASPAIPEASACPMCKVANESEDRRPKAYMYSILFMLAMPATVLTGFGVGFYRLSKQGAAAADDDLTLSEENDESV